MRDYDLTNANWRKSTHSDGNGGNCVEIGYDFPGAARWRKSTHSSGDAGKECVEIAYNFPGAARWRKSTYSDGNGGSCVEIADGVPGVVPVRDSKVVAGAVVLVGSVAWARFIGGLCS
ncbi:DUF397 domain-containing protein [Streptomyces sp. NPDC005423]|uniref:DUF397 domain-containing protein n=1 Tax=Streptomyces sp. NPDC005423 TaxID=3155343 RepID=UPI0033B68D9D